MTWLLIAQLVWNGPRLAPDQAAAVLARCACASNVTTWPAPLPPGPRVVYAPSSPTAGPFGEFAPLPETRPLSNGPYVYVPFWYPTVKIGTRSAAGRRPAGRGK